MPGLTKPGYGHAFTAPHHGAMDFHGDLPSDLDDMIRFGVVVSVDGARAVVACGEITSPPLPWLTLAGQVSAFVPPSPGEQVVVLCPSGDIAGAIILGGLYSNANPAPAESPRILLKCADGSTFAYDAGAHALTVTLAAGSGKIVAPQGFEIQGDVTITGKLSTTDDVTIDGKLSTTDDVTVTGKVTASDDVIADTIHLKTHVHKDTKPEPGSFSGAPKP